MENRKLFRTTLMYCVSVWGSTYKSNLGTSQNLSWRGGGEGVEEK